MSRHWDEFSKSLAEETVPRRESLRRLGVVLAGAVLSPFGLESALAAGSDPCKAFCACRRKSDQNQCLRACRACRDASGTLLGSCGNYFCCGAGQSSCGRYCADLADDPYNCGACGYACDEPGPYEYGACIDGECRYACAAGAVRCNGTCTYLESDPDNCGACGRVCGGPVPYCSQGECACAPLPYVALCDGVCIDLLSDAGNCGACGNVCEPGFVCSSGACWDPACQFYDC